MRAIISIRGREYLWEGEGIENGAELLNLLTEVRKVWYNGGNKYCIGEKKGIEVRIIRDEDIISEEEYHSGDMVIEKGKED